MEETKQEFKSIYKYRIKVELIDGVKYYAPERMTYPLITPDVRDYTREGIWQPLPIISTDSLDWDTVQSIIDEDKLAEKRRSELFVIRYLEA